MSALTELQKELDAIRALITVSEGTVTVKKGIRDKATFEHMDALQVLADRRAQAERYESALALIAEPAPEDDLDDLIESL
jgi:hypothetical protein